MTSIDEVAFLLSSKRRSGGDEADEMTPEPRGASLVHVETCGRLEGRSRFRDARNVPS
jgi:hypothetical protein